MSNNFVEELNRLGLTVEELNTDVVVVGGAGLRRALRCPRD